MKASANKPSDRPTSAQLKAELVRVKHNTLYQRLLRSTVYTLIVVAAIAVLVATIWLPVLQRSTAAP